MTKDCHKNRPTNCLYNLTIYNDNRYITYIARGVTHQPDKFNNYKIRTISPPLALLLIEPAYRKIIYFPCKTKTFITF